jgi:endonuclease/exonuclease/phosphatase family metal-dependent hydrolase
LLLACAVAAACGDASPQPTTRPPPETVLYTATPARTTVGTALTVTFGSDQAESFECRVDAAEFAPCTSPYRMTALAGVHLFQVRARDGAGTVDPTPDGCSYTGVAADTSPPDTLLISGPSGNVRTGTPIAVVFASETLATFECRVDAQPFAPCASPVSAIALEGPHAIQVRAVDEAGNVDPTPAVASYTGTAAGGTTSGAARIRFVASNLTSGNNQSYDPGEGARILQGLKPDVVLVQEFKVGDNSDAALRGWVDRTFGTSTSGQGFAVYREARTGGIPNGIVSRYPILSSGQWADPQVPDRSSTWAQIDLPGSRDLWVVSVHLHTANASSRNIQAGVIVSSLANLPIRPTDYLAIGGDFNTDNRSEPCLTTLGSVFATTGPNFPADAAGNSNTNATRGKPYDWVAFSPNLSSLQVPVVVGSSTFPNGLVVDTRVYSPLAEIAPAQAGDSGSTNMQHMAVVRDVVVTY